MSYKGQLNKTNFFEDRDKPNTPKDVTTLTDLKNHIETKHRIKNGIPFEDQYTRMTFAIDKDLNRRLNQVKERKEKGWKTMALNEAVAALLREYE